MAYGEEISHSSFNKMTALVKWQQINPTITLTLQEIQGVSSLRQCYYQTSDISRTLVDNNIVDHSDVVGASPAGVAPITSSFAFEHLASVDWAKTTARRDAKHSSFGIWCDLYERFDGTPYSTAFSGWQQRKHQSSTLLTLCESNPAVTGGFPTKRSLMWKVPA